MEKHQNLRLFKPIVMVYLIFAEWTITVFCWYMEISLCCYPIYWPWTASSEKKLNTTLIGLDRQRIWSSHICLFKTFVTQTFEWSLQWISILLENENLDKKVLGVGKAVLGLGIAVLKYYFSIATLLPLIGDLSKNYKISSTIQRFLFS